MPCESLQLTMLSSGVRAVDTAETEWINIFVTAELCLNGTAARETTLAAQTMWELRRSKRKNA